MQEDPDISATKEQGVVGDNIWNYCLQAHLVKETKGSAKRRCSLAGTEHGVVDLGSSTWHCYDLVVQAESGRE